jgi:hypothetical protein
MSITLTDAPAAHAAVVGKLPRIIARKKFSRLLRLMKYAREANMTAIFMCKRCKEPVKLQRGSGIIDLIAHHDGVNEKTDAFSLSCSCTRWTVR